MIRKCQRKDCKNLLPPSAVKQKKYCSPACQVRDWRNRKKIKGQEGEE
ncbi:MAG TPA: hypothetical protein VK735_18490 [Pseudonocardia sp.]|nr:hypothetical protein [Pseudonocardia sp.]HTF49435.1 hypothetical protein [Pseudonocardia sp.]